MEERKEARTVVCRCPYCDAEIVASAEVPLFCQPCQIVIVTCTRCGGAAREGAEECPHCGEPLRAR